MKNQTLKIKLLVYRARQARDAAHVRVTERETEGSKQRQTETDRDGQRQSNFEKSNFEKSNFEKSSFENQTLKIKL